MALNALLKFWQGATIGNDGEALEVTSGTTVNINSANLTDVDTWTLERLDAPPGSGLEVVPGNPVLVDSGGGGDPVGYTFVPPAGVSGCYRFRLVFVDSNGVTDTDIRNVGVRDSLSGMIPPPFQDLPRPLPLTGPGSKPNELNFGGQPYGWMGEGSGDGLHHDIVRRSGLVLAEPGDTEARPLEDKISPVGGLRALKVDGAYGKTIAFTGPDPVDAYDDWFVLRAGRIKMSYPYNIAWDGQHFWIPANYRTSPPIAGGSTTPDGYARFSRDGLFVEEQSFGNNLIGTNCIQYDAANDRMIALRSSWDGTPTNYLVEVSRDFPAVLGTPVALTGGSSTPAWYFEIIDGYIWVHPTSYYGQLTRVDLNNFAFQTHFPSLGPTPVTIDPTDRYGDGEGRVFLVDGTTLRRYKYDGTADGTYALTGGSYRAIRVNPTTGRIWLAWTTGDFNVTTLDAEPLGNNPLTVVGIAGGSSYWALDWYFSSSGQAAVMTGDIGDSVWVLLTETLPSTLGVDSVQFLGGWGTFDTPEFNGLRQFITIADGNIQWCGLDSTGTRVQIWEMDGGAAAWNTSLADIAPRVMAWGTGGIVKASASDQFPDELGNKIAPQPYGSVIFQNTGGSNEQLRVYTYADVLQSFVWRYSVNTAMAKPGINLFRLNNATPHLATAIAFDTTIEPYHYSVDLNASTILGAIEIGDILHMRRVWTYDGDQVLGIAEVTSVTNNGTWFELGISWISLPTGSLPLAANNRCHFTILKSPKSGGKTRLPFKGAITNGSPLDVNLSVIDLFSLPDHIAITIRAKLNAYDQATPGSGAHFLETIHSYSVGGGNPLLHVWDDTIGEYGSGPTLGLVAAAGSSGGSAARVTFSTASALNIQLNGYLELIGRTR